MSFEEETKYRWVGEIANSSILPLLYSFGRTNMILLNIYHKNVHVTRVDNKLGPNSLLVLYPVRSYRRPICSTTPYHPSVLFIENLIKYVFFWIVGNIFV